MTVNCPVQYLAQTISHHYARQIAQKANEIKLFCAEQKSDYLPFLRRLA
jgi:hypothetical protein